MEMFFNGVFSDLGLDADGLFPISDNAIEWTEYDK